MEAISRGTDGLLDPWYVTGFLEGNGSFTYSRSGRQIGLYLAIKLSARERPLLEALQIHFGGIGRLYDVPPSSVYLRVSHRAELERVVLHFDHYPLRSTKAAHFALWREMVLLRCHHFREDRRDELDDLANRLSALSPRSRPRPFDTSHPVG